jgi:hypothetical protein
MWQRGEREQGRRWEKRERGSEDKGMRGERGNKGERDKVRIGERDRSIGGRREEESKRRQYEADYGKKRKEMIVWRERLKQSTNMPSRC